MKSILLLLLWSTTAFCDIQSDSCSYFKYCSGGGTGASGGRSSKSLPSAATSASFNPSNISSIKGLGLETLFQARNPLGFSLVTGNGKVGGALISPNVENSFFGNRSLEIDELYYDRLQEKKRYKNKKVNLALGIKIIDKEKVGFDIGFSAKRNPDVKKINPGIGFSAKLWFLNVGGYVYKDDVKLQFQPNQFDPRNGQYYVAEYPSTTYQETYTVRTFTVGAKIKNLAIDVGTIKTEYEFYHEPTSIVIYSASYNFGRMLFNFALRHETSPNMKEENGQLLFEREKRDTYYGFQFMVNPHLVIGLGYNTYLLHEVSGTLTLFL